MGNNRRYSFFQLFTKGNDYRIVIPIIQRDYAQGRDNDKAKEVRGDFLGQLLTYMSAECGSHDLDFVYGMSEVSTDNSKKKEFIPLDGQQRLTTLFLIHFYLAARSKSSIESNTFFKTMQVKSGHLTESLFTYRTRSSAAEFCNCLINEENDFSEVFVLDETKQRTYKKPLSDYIRNSSWFYPDWLQDPTVNGMLRMLDDVDKKFDKCKHQETLRRLLSDTDPSVTFIFMDLDDYKLTDDLYIKMNSRGKPLTPFENFKAKYEQYISREEKGETVNPDEANDPLGRYEYSKTESGETIKQSKLLCQLRKEIAGQNDPVIKTVKDYFAFNIDTQWSQLFWEYCKEEIQLHEANIKKETKESENATTIDRLLSDTLDLKLSRFIKAALASQYAIEHSSGTITIPEELTGEKPLSFTTLENIDALSVDGIVLLTRLFDLYSKRKKIIMPEWSKVYYDEEETFKALITGKEFTFPKRLLHYAYTMFRLKFGDDNVSSLVEWMRFMYNVTLEDNTIQAITRNTYHRAVAAVNKLLDLLTKFPDKSVTRFLASGQAPDVFDFFPDYQYREELLKSFLFKRDRVCVLHSQKDTDLSTPLSESDCWGRIILKLEAHPYFSGQIGFILKMAGVDDYYSENQNLDWDEDSDVVFKREVIKYGNIASKIFAGGYTNRTMADAALFERAMLAVSPEYLHYNFLNSINRRAGSNNLLRDLSWKCFLRLSSEHSDIYWMVKSLFDILDVDNPEQSLLDIIKKGASGSQWQKDIVKYEYLMRKSKNGFVAASEDGHMILKDSIQFSKWDHEVYSLVLYWDYLTDKGNIYDISEFSLSYGNSNSWQEVPFVKLTHGDIVVKVKSYVAKDSGELICHYIRIDADGDRELESFLKSQGFEKNSETDTILRRKEPKLCLEESINDYRERVTENINSFISSLSLYLKARENGQQ